MIFVRWRHIEYSAPAEIQSFGLVAPKRGKTKYFTHKFQFSLGGRCGDGGRGGGRGRGKEGCEELDGRWKSLQGQKFVDISDTPAFHSKLSYDFPPTVGEKMKWRGRGLTTNPSCAAVAKNMKSLTLHTSL